MILTKTETQFLAAMKAALAGETLDLMAADFRALFSMAEEQKLLPFVYEALRRCPGAGENQALFAQAKSRVRAQVLSQTLRSAAFRELYRQLRQAGLHPLVVKGQLCSPLYPLEDYRLSGDDDLYLLPQELEACCAFLQNRGLVAALPEEEWGTRDEITFMDPRGPLHLEIHRNLFDSGEDRFGRLNELFREPARHPVELEGFLSLEPQAHLLYLILHAYKHFVARGVGLRQFCDIGLWAAAYGDRVNWQRLYEDCAGAGAAVFGAAVFGICREYLGVEVSLPEPWCRLHPPLEPLCCDGLEGGIYGSAHGDRLHASTMTLRAFAGEGRGLSPLRTLFPPRDDLLDRYPYLKKGPWLLPWAWLQRLCHYAAEDHGKKNSPAGAVRLARRRVELLKLYEVMDR